MPELLNDIETLKPLDYARRWWIPRRDNNKPISAATMHRWARRGVLGVKLEVLFTADGAVTSEAACRQFLSAVDRTRRQRFAGGDGSPASYAASEDQLRAAGLTR